MKFSPVFVLSMVVASLLANEDVAVNRRPREQNPRNMPCNNDKDPCCVDPCMVPLEKCPLDMMVTPPRAPRVCQGSCVSMEASFIWWKSYLSGLSYATSGETDGGTHTAVGASANQGRVVEPAFSFEPGFKVGVGGDLPYDGWDLWGNYTWLASGGTRTNSIAASTGSALTSLVDIVMNDGTVGTFFATHAHSRFKQDTSIGDLELARSFFVSRSLLLRPHVGLKTAWIHDSVRFDYTFEDATIYDGADDVVTGSVVRNQNMWGLGVRTGLNGDWKITPNWGFYGKFAASAVWSDFHLTSRDVTLSTGSIRTTTNLNTYQSIQRIVPVVETTLGMSFTGWSKCNKHRFVVRAGWEQQVWFDMNQMLHTARNGAMTFQGLTADFSLSF